MSKFLTAVLCAVLYGSFVISVPVSDIPSSSALSSSTEASSSTSTSTSISTSQSSSGTGTSTASSAAAPSPTVPYASDDPNYWLWNETTTTDPQPERGKLGATILGPENVPIDRQNPDMLAPPTTDQGTV